MIELTIASWLIIAVLALCCLAAGYQMGHRVGFNDGLRKAHEIMDEHHHV